MSMVRICDCPNCSDELEHQIWDDQWTVISDKDICNDCLYATNGCLYWQPRVLPTLSELQKTVAIVYTDLINRQLRQPIEFIRMIEDAKEAN